MLSGKLGGGYRPFNPIAALERPILEPDTAPGRGSTARAGKKRPYGPLEGYAAGFKAA